MITEGESATCRVAFLCIIDDSGKTTKLHDFEFENFSPIYGKFALECR